VVTPSQKSTCSVQYFFFLLPTSPKGFHGS